MSSPTSPETSTPPQAEHDNATTTKSSPGRTFMVSGLGTALEYYDFSIYGLAAALVFPAVFFPNLSPMVGSLVAFAAFGVGFIARPLGGIVLGHLGDRIGRKPVLVATLIVMGACTFLIGCLPGAAVLGNAAAVILVALRLIQGFAAGGEWGGASLVGIEGAPEGKRGLWGSFTSMGIGLGTLLGTIVFAIVSALEGGAISDFGWRIPFWAGGLLVIVGLIARLKLPTEEPNRDEKPAKIPLMDAIRERPRAVLCAIGVSFGYNTIAYIVSVFFLAYVAKAGYSSTTSLVFQIFSASALLLSALFFGWLSDRWGRKRVMIGGAAALIVFFFVFFPVVGLHATALTALTFVVVGAVTGATQGPLPSLLGEQFPARMRFSGISVTYQVGAAIGGGTASTVATALLIGFNGNPIGVAIYASAAALILALCVLGLRETSHLSVEEINA
jgi:MFS family permease